MTNTPEAVRQRCSAGLREQEDQLRTYFAEAVRRGDLPAGSDVEHLAAYFVAIRQSIGLLWRAGEPRAKLTEIIKVSTQILPAPSRRKATAGRRH